MLRRNKQGQLYAEALLMLQNRLGAERVAAVMRYKVVQDVIDGYVGVFNHIQSKWQVVYLLGFTVKNL